MPELKVNKQPVDLSLAQIVQLGKLKQRNIITNNPRGKSESRRATSIGAQTNMRRRTAATDGVEDENACIPEIEQTNLTLSMLQNCKRSSVSSTSSNGNHSMRSNNQRLIFCSDSDSNTNLRNRTITAPAFIT